MSLFSYTVWLVTVYVVFSSDRNCVSTLCELIVPFQHKSKVTGYCVFF